MVHVSNVSPIQGHMETEKNAVQIIVYKDKNYLKMGLVKLVLPSIELVQIDHIVS